MTLIFVICDMLKKKKRKGKACCIMLIALFLFGLCRNCCVQLSFTVLIILVHCLLWFSSNCQSSMLCKLLL